MESLREAANGELADGKLEEARIKGGSKVKIPYNTKLN
jgi:hypothetical protein